MNNKSFASPQKWLEVKSAIPKLNNTGFHSYPQHLRKVAFLRPNLQGHPSEVGQNALGPNLPTAHIDRVFRVHRGGSAVVKTCFPPLFPANSTITRLGSVCTLFTFGRLPATFGRVRAAFHCCRLSGAPKMNYISFLGRLDGCEAPGNRLEGTREK